MSGDEPRRSIRSNKGQHKHASSSPAPTAKTPKTTKAKPRKKSTEPERKVEEEEDDDDETIRCICGNDDRNDKRAFIACDSCSVWQHNICMGMPEDDDEVPDHYYCEQCVPDDHQETVQALNRGEKIWDTRNKIYLSEKKMQRSRKNKGKVAEITVSGWLKKAVPPEPKQPTPTEPVASPPQAVAAEPSPPEENQEAGTKRKRGDAKEEQSQEDLGVADEKASRSGRHDKRRKSSAPEEKVAADPETALVSMDQLPADRKKVANALSQIISKDIAERVKEATFQLPSDQTAKTLGEHHAVRIEYSLHINHGSTKDPAYTAQFRALNANLKRNRTLIQRLLQNTLTADELSTMSTSHMASDELQRERAEMKEALDRQAISIAEEGPRFRQDHKGYHAIEDEGRGGPDNRAPTPQPPAAPSNAADEQPREQSQEVREPPLRVDDATTSGAAGTEKQPLGGQQLDMNNIWAKTAQSPVTGSAPSGPQHLRRMSSNPAPPARTNGATHDPDVDRMLADDNNDDEEYTPAAASSSGPDVIVWQGKLIQNSEDDAAVLNARFVAGRDLTSTVSWAELLPPTLSIDGRLQISKAEDYLCGLRWSSSTDVSVLALTPQDNANAFKRVFEYFHSRRRYAVIEKGKPPMIKDFYIMPVEVGEELPEHIQMLEYCAVKTPVEERVLLATLAVNRAPDADTLVDGASYPQRDKNEATSAAAGIPQHVRTSMSGPAGSPIGDSQEPFSPPVAGHQAGHAIVPKVTGYGGTFPPHPFTPPAMPTLPQRQQSFGSQQILPLHQPGAMGPDPRVNAILGDLQFTLSAQAILQSGSELHDNQLHNLRDILLKEPRARDDITMLSVMLSK